MPDDPSATPDRYRIDDLVIELRQHRVFRGRDEIKLPKLSFDLLVALAAAAPDTLSVDELIERVWAGAVVSNATVAKRVELLRTALGDDSHKPRYVALDRGHGYRMIAEVRPAVHGHSRQRSRRHLIAAVLGLAALAGLGLLLFDADTPPPEKSLAVLPFVSLSDEPQDEIFADGLTEELSHTLAGFSDLKVTGRTSSFYYKGRNEDMREIGETLGVAHLLEGSVRRSGERLRVTAQLVDTTDGFHLFSETYDRTMDDVLQIQEDIARLVAQTLRSTLLEDEQVTWPTSLQVDPRAYAKYLRALSLFHDGNSTALAEAHALLDEVVALDPGFAEGWARLASVNGHRLMGHVEDYPVSRAEGWRQIVAANERALSLDPDNASAHANLAGIAWLMEGNAAKAAPLIERAIELDPHDLDIVGFATTFAMFIGRLDEAIELGEYLVSRDPLYTRFRFWLAKAYLYAGQLDNAEEAYRTVRTIDDGCCEWSIGNVLLLKGETEAALASFELLEHHFYLRLQGRAMALHDLGRIAERDRELELLVERWADKVPSVIARAYAYIGEIDAAFEWLDRSIPANIVDLQTEYLSPLLRNLHADPRWDQLLERIGRSPQQLAEIEFSLDPRDIEAR